MRVAGCLVDGVRQQAHEARWAMGQTSPCQTRLSRDAAKHLARQAAAEEARRGEGVCRGNKQLKRDARQCVVVGEEEGHEGCAVSDERRVRVWCLQLQVKAKGHVSDLFAATGVAPLRAN